MTSSLLKGLALELNKTETENGALTNKSTFSATLDFFALAGAMRKDPKKAVSLFKRALAEDKKYAFRILFYLRDIRGGQGERAIFRECLKALNEKQIGEVAQYINEYGRWDDIIQYVDNSAVVAVVGKQIAQDSKVPEGESISLLAKWMPSTNTSSKETRALANKWVKALGITQKDYRRILSHLRKRISLLEHAMMTKEYNSIDYSKIPSQAFRKHIKAFKRNDEKRFEEFITKVENGEATVNAGTIYPYELIEQLNTSNEPQINALWNALPDYTKGKNAIVMADVSGSMSGRPMATSVSLAMYFAQRNQGQFHGYFMTFSEDPELVFIPEGMSFSDQVRYVSHARWGMSTNLIKGFEKILVAAKNNNTPANEMPSVLYIISDMEFNETGSGQTNFDEIRQLYALSGYELPTIVFWNVDARNTQVPAVAGDNNVSLISGSSASSFTLAVEGKTPEETMFDLLNSERYSKIDITV